MGKKQAEERATVLAAIVSVDTKVNAAVTLTENLRDKLDRETGDNNNGLRQAINTARDIEDEHNKERQAAIAAVDAKVTAANLDIVRIGTIVAEHMSSLSRDK